MADVIETADGGGQWTTSPQPGCHIGHLGGRKRRNRSESDFCLPDSRRRRVEAVTNKTLSVSHRTSAESSPSPTCGTHNQFQPLNFEHGTPPIDGTSDTAYGPDTEHTLIGRGANSNREDEIVPNITLGVPPATPATPVNIDESMNRYHEHERHQEGWKDMNVQPVTAADLAFITVAIDSPADLQDVFDSPATWALGCGIQPASLTNISIKPLVDRCWLLTATISRRASGMDDLRRDWGKRREKRSPDPDTSSDYCPSEGEMGLRRTKRGQWTAEEDHNLRKWRRLGKAWSWIFNQFPERTEGAVRSRWFVVLKPRAGRRPRFLVF